MSEPMARRFILALLAAVVLAPPSTAQMRRGSFHGSAQVAPRSGAAFIGHHRSVVASGYYLGNTPFFYADYPFEPATPETATPQIIVVQVAAPADTPPEAKAAPLLIELQGDRYVSYGGIAESPEREMIASSDSAGRPFTRSSPSTKSAAHPRLRTEASTPPALAELPPTVLVYRDGHREEVPDYAIVGGVVYAHNNDWQTGYGMKNIQVSALDISATMKVNRENGVNFVLPSGPNEVVTRP